MNESEIRASADALARAEETRTAIAPPADTYFGMSASDAYGVPPAHDPPVVHEVGDFDYIGRGYATAPPMVRQVPG